MTADLLAPGAPDLRAADLDQLAAMLDLTEFESSTWRAILAEAERRDRIEIARRRRTSEHEAWMLATHAQFLAAEADCRGELLSRAGKAAGVSDWPGLWTGPESRAMRYASEEMRGWWESHGGRLTIGAYRAGLAGERSAARDRDDLAGMPAPWIQLPGGRIRAATVAGRAAWWAVDAAGRATLHATRGAAGWAVCAGGGR